MMTDKTSSLNLSGSPHQPGQGRLDLAYMTANGAAYQHPSGTERKERDLQYRSVPCRNGSLAIRAVAALF
jgi:hypothetical protein